jgi:N-acetylmuramoyl-L-alanine amidase
MKRFILLTSLALLAAASIVLAQSTAQPTTQATLRTQSGDRQIAVAHQNGQTYFSADDVVAALGGSVAADAHGYRVTINNNVAAFGPDSRFGVVRDDLIEMPAAPVVIDNHPFVTIQFFQGFLAKTADLDVVWDERTKLVQIRPLQHTVVGVQVSVANVQGISKIVFTLSQSSGYAIVKEQGGYTIRFAAQIRPPFAEQTYEDPNVAKITFSGTDARIQLSSPDVVGDAYKLENPYRVVLDVRKVAASPNAPALPVPNKPVEPPGIHTIVIDPGHGGKDIGATGPGGLLEKDATLAIANKLAASLATKLGARVILTREDDSVVSLDQRTAVANQYKADLFLSVHMNAAPVKGAHGSEVYFLSLEASDELAKKAAESENASAAAHSPSSQGDLKLILWDLAQQEYLAESSRFAQSIQEEMNALAGIQNRGVKQAPFKVLVGATMPAALVEVAFISNPDEETKLKNEQFQNTVVEALTRAVQRYKTDYETRIGVAQPAPATPPPAATTTTTTARTGT